MTLQRAVDVKSAARMLVVSFLHFIVRPLHFGAAGPDNFVVGKLGLKNKTYYETKFSPFGPCSMLLRGYAGRLRQ